MCIYITVETLAKSLEDAISDGLSVKLAKTASYVTTRRSCACRAQGSHIETESNGTFFSVSDNKKRCVRSFNILLFF